MNKWQLKHQGFTLIEVLIAMTLLSLMVVLLFASMRIGGESWDKGEKKIDEVNEVTVAYNFFQRYLSTAMLVSKNPSDPATFAFRGETNWVQFASYFPASAGKNGIQLFDVRLKDDDDDDSQYLNVAITPFFSVAEGESEWEAEEVVLIPHVKAFNVQYFGPDDPSISESYWQEQWLEKAFQPHLVKIHVELDNGMVWPDMVIEVKPKTPNPNAQ
jgi:general secretion pathway protein J